MSVTKEALLAAVQSFTDADAAHAQARDAATQAAANTQTVIQVEQAHIDEATAHYDAEVNQAKSDQAAAEQAEADAGAAEEGAKASLISLINEFATQG